MKVLIVEDDDRIALPLKEDLEHQHALVQMAHDGQVGYDMALIGDFDLILLDLMLPGMDGMTICRKLREKGCTSAIIILTARSKTATKIEGLDCGADDYLAKPFELDELAARIRAVMRRGTETKAPLVVRGDLTLDPRTQTIAFKGKALDLTPTEYRILAHLLNNPEWVYGKDELISRLWDNSEVVSEHVVKTHMKGLRNKLSALGAPRDLVETVYGVGYRLKADA